MQAVTEDCKIHINFKLCRRGRRPDDPSLHRYINLPITRRGTLCGRPFLSFLMTYRFVNCRSNVTKSSTAQINELCCSVFKEVQTTNLSRCIACTLCLNLIEVFKIDLVGLFLVLLEICIDFFGVNVVFVLIVERIPYLSEEGIDLCFIIVCPAELLLLSLLKR